MLGCGGRTDFSAHPTIRPPQRTCFFVSVFSSQSFYLNLSSLASIGLSSFSIPSCVSPVYWMGVGAIPPCLRRRKPGIPCDFARRLWALVQTRCERLQIRGGPSNPVLVNFPYFGCAAQTVDKRNQSLCSQNRGMRPACSGAAAWGSRADSYTKCSFVGRDGI
jgi:hypothetical protein